MSKTLTIKDETATGKILNQILLEIESEIITIEALIKMRVEAEVVKYNSMKAQIFNGLVQPTKAEQTLNGGYKLQKGVQIDVEKQVYIALKAFQENGYFILVDNKQATSLQQEIHTDVDTELSFIKLTPLVGG